MVCKTIKVETKLSKTLKIYTGSFILKWVIQEDDSDSFPDFPGLYRVYKKSTQAEDWSTAPCTRHHRTSSVGNFGICEEAQLGLELPCLISDKSLYHLRYRMPNKETLQFPPGDFP